MANKLTSMVDIVADNRQIFVEEYRTKIIEECARAVECFSFVITIEEIAKAVRALKDKP